MNFLKNNVLFFTFLCCFQFSCVENKSSLPFNPKVNKPILDSLRNLYGNRIAVLSCLACGCFKQDYNSRFKTEQDIPKGYILITDTTCNKLKFPAVHVDNKILENLSDDFYNLTFIKITKDSFELKNLPIEKSKLVSKEAIIFFNL